MAQQTPGRGFGGSTRPTTSNPGYRDRAGYGNPPEDAARIDTSSIVFGEQIDPRLFADIAEECAKAVSPQGRGHDVNKGTQLRRFYDELVMLQGKVGNSDERYRVQAPFIQMLKAKVAYAVGRKKVDTNFEQLLRRVIEQATDHGRLAQAKLFMEAFMAFYKVHGPRD